jgi:hypothetical protein
VYVHALSVGAPVGQKELSRHSLTCWAAAGIGNTWRYHLVAGGALKDRLQGATQAPGRIVPGHPRRAPLKLTETRKEQS